jgi:hypothetical protein
MPRPALFQRLLRLLSRRKLERARRELSLAGTTPPSRAARRTSALALAETAPGAPPAAPRRPSGPSRRRTRSPRLLEQLSLDLGPERPRWTPSRLVVRSPHRERILEYLEFARRFFPELEGVNIRVGLAQKRGVLGWGSLDPERPGVWVRPRQLQLFTIAHEYTHLLQARGLVPRGERQCDLWALARSPLLIDSPPNYLKLPRALKRGRPTNDQAHALCAAAREAIAAREAGDRRYLARFEAALAEADPDPRFARVPPARVPRRREAEPARARLPRVSPA